jgi:DNA processing protein
LSEFEYLFPQSNRPMTVNETGVLPALDLNENEQAVFSAVKLAEETSIDEIIRASGLPTSAVNVALFSLEMKRLVKQLPGKLFVRNR